MQSHILNNMSNQVKLRIDSLQIRSLTYRQIENTVLCFLRWRAWDYL